MAIKSVAIDSVSTPAPKIAQAEEMLGKVIQAPKTRWQPGSLAGSALGIVADPCLAIVSNLAVAVGLSGAGILTSVLSSLSLDLADAAFYGTATPGASRARPLVPDATISGIVEPPLFDVAAATSVNKNPDLGSALCIAPTPAYSAAQILNIIDSNYQDIETPLDYVAILDQETGSVVCWPVTKTKAALVASLASVVAVFDLTEPTAEEPTIGPVWG